MYHQSDPTTTVLLFLHKNSWRIRANPIVHHVSPVVEDDMPLRLSSRSALKLLDRRLDELALPKQGTKLDKWTRLENGEKELIRERKSRAATDAVREAGPQGGRREAAIPISVRRTRRRKFTSSRICLDSRGASSASRGEYRESSQVGDVRTCGIYTPCHRILIKTAGIVCCVTADEEATCLVLLDVDTGYMKAVPVAGKTVTDYFVQGGKRFVEQFFRRGVHLRCDGGPTTLAYGAKLLEFLPESVVLERTPRHDR